MGRAEIETVYQKRFEGQIAWRTLLRRVKEVERHDRMRTEGAGRSTRYLPGPALVLTDPPVEDGYVPISRESARLRARILQPLFQRKPVGYDPELLERYTSGSTWYLPLPVWTRLDESGRTPGEDQPAGTYARDIFGRLLIDLAWASSQLEGEHLFASGHAAPDRVRTDGCGWRSPERSVTSHSRRSDPTSQPGCR